MPDIGVDRCGTNPNQDLSVAGEGFVDLPELEVIG